MKKKDKYDPEDIESLLLHKAFNELYPEEKDFVLRHVDSEIEYNEMRDTLLMVNTLTSTPQGPNENTKERVMAAYRAKHASTPRFSLNGWFASLFVSPAPFYKRPAFAFSVVALVVFGAFLVYPDPAQTEARQLADNRKLEMPERDTVVVENAETDSKLDSEESQAVPAEETDTKEVSNALDMIESIPEADLNEELESKDTYKFAEAAESQEELPVTSDFEGIKANELADDEIAFRAEEELVSESEVTAPNAVIEEGRADFYFDNQMGNTSDMSISLDEVDVKPTTSYSPAAIDIITEEVATYQSAKVASTFAEDADGLVEVVQHPPMLERHLNNQLLKVLKPTY